MFCWIWVSFFVNLELTRLIRSSQEVSDRIDTLIAKIRALHTGNMNGENGQPMDIVLVCL